MREKKKTREAVSHSASGEGFFGTKSAIGAPMTFLSAKRFFRFAIELQFHFRKNTELVYVHNRVFLNRGEKKSEDGDVM